MFLQNIFQFAKGYVILILTGFSIERFLNICMRRKIKVWKVQFLNKNKTQICISAKDFKKLRPIAYKTRTRVHIKRKCGLQVLMHSYRKRIFFAGGLFLCVAFLMITSQFIWSIDIIGADKAHIGQIREASELAGIKIGAFKPSLPNGNEIKNVLLTNTEHITWAWVYLKGTKAVIEVREGIMPPAVIDKNAPCDIAAQRDGMITSVVVKKGIAFCKKGDVVLKGDLLVGGTMTNAEGEYRLEHALGDIYAATWHKRSAQIKRFREVRSKTGKKKTFTEIKCFSRLIPLYRKVQVPFAEYSLTEKRRELKWGGEHYIGLAASTYLYEEEVIERNPMTDEEATELAAYELEKEIALNLLPGSVLQNKIISTTEMDEETLEVTVEMQFIEKIGYEVPIVIPEENPETEEKQE